MINARGFAFLFLLRSVSSAFYFQFDVLRYAHYEISKALTEVMKI